VLFIGCDQAAEMALPIKGERIVTLAPNITEMVFAMGQGQRVVGVSSFCDYPAEVAPIENVGGYTNPDLEKLARLRPDLIILAGYHEKVAKFAQKNGIPVVQLQIENLASILNAIQRIGDALSCIEEAEILRSRVQGELEAVRKAAEGLPKPTVLIITSRQTHDLDSLYTAGGSSFLSGLVELAGGTNIYKDTSQAYLEASKETIVVRGPEVIIEFHAGERLSQEEKARYVADWDQLSSIPAVKARRVHIVTEAYSLRPGPRVAQTARIIAKVLHPDMEVLEP